MKKQKMNKKPSYQKLKLELTQVFNKYIRLKGNNICVICGSQNNSTAGHVFSSVNLSTKWDESNVFVQCMGCNLRHEYDSYPYFNWYINKFGKKKFDLLYIKHKSVVKFSNSDLQTMINIYKKKLKKIELNSESSSYE